MPHSPLYPPAQPAPGAILGCLESHHVLSLCVIDGQGPWAASCFYAFDAQAMDLLVMTSASTRHGRRMLEVPAIAGTIAGQPHDIAEIRGIQFTARAERLAGEARQEKLRLYTERHPVARVLQSDLWCLHLAEVKYTDNRISFARKLRWTRHGGVQEQGR